MPIEEGADVEKLAKTLAVFAPDLMLNPGAWRKKIVALSALPAGIIFDEHGIQLGTKTHLCAPRCGVDPRSVVSV
jgi:hypothetical protein